jgi:hypothetical protein
MVASASAEPYILNGTALQEANLAIQSANPNNVGAVIQGAKNQTADLLDLRDANGDNLASVSSFGALAADGITDNGPLFINGYGVAQGGFTVNGELSVNPFFSSGKALSVADTHGQLVLYVDTINDRVVLQGHVKSGNATGTTTATIEKGAGSGASVSFEGTNNDDTAGTVMVTTGSGTAVGNLATVTFGSPYSYGIAPHVILSPNSSSAAIAKYYTTSVTPSGFTIAVAGSKPKANATLSFDYYAEQ